MSLLRAITTLFLFTGAIFIKSSAVDQSDHKYLSSILDHLNSKADKIYHFNDGLFYLKKQLRTDVHVYDVTVDVDEKCTFSNPGVPCIEGPLRCTATMIDDGVTVKVLSDVTCTHHQALEQTGYIGEMLIEPHSRKTNFEVSHEPVYSDPEPPFVVERHSPPSPCLGCLFDLHEDAEGVKSLVNSALRHIESERENRFILGRVLRVQQQVVNGVKYILLAEVSPSLCEKGSTVFDCPPNESEEPLICEIHYIEKPWISTAKHIISNNCTQSQEFTLGKNDQDNEIKATDSKKDDKMSPSRLTELESQILLDSERGFLVQTVREQVDAVEGNSGISNPLVVEELAPVVIQTERLEPVGERRMEPQIVTDLQEEAVMPDYQNDQPLTTSLNGDRATTIETISEKVETTSGTSVKVDKSSEESSESSEEGNTPATRVKRSCDNGGERKDEDSSSSSSSSEEDDDKKNDSECDIRKGGKIQKKDESSSSSSSEEGDNDIKKDQKRSIGELEKITLEEKPLVKELADYAAKTLDKIDNDKYKRVVLQILGAKKLRLDGTYYSLILRMGVSQCLEEKSNKIDCLTNLHENLTKICKVQIHVGDNDDYINWKLIKSQCQNIKKDEYDRNRTNYSRYKRGLVGAPVEASVTDPVVLAFVKDTLPHLDSELKTTNKHKVVNIESVTKQVVAGLKYRIKVNFVLSECGLNVLQDVEKCGELKDDKPKGCELVVWDRPWLNNTKYDLNCNADSIQLSFKKVANSRAKRQVVGAPVEASKDDPQIILFVKDSLPHLDKHLQSMKKHKLQKIVSVTEQVVAGVSYKIKMYLTLSDCEINDIKAAENCNELKGDAPKLCQLTVWDRSWLKMTEYKLNCNEDSIKVEFEKSGDNRSKRQVPGAPIEASKDDPEILVFVKDSLPHLDKELKSANKHKLHNVVSVTKQVVAGISYNIKMYLTLSDCEINEVKDVENCNQLKGDEPKLCELKVWDRSWLNHTEYELNCNKDTIKVKFEKNASRSKRQALGAPEEASKDDPEVLLFVKDSLPHLDKELKSTNKHKLHSVVSVTKQVVAGVSYTIKMYLTLSDCQINEVKDVENCNQLKGDEPKLCELKVWDRSWLKQTEYELNCKKDTIKVKFEKNSNTRSKRQSFGAPEEASKDDPEILLFAKDSLPHLDKKVQTKNKHKVQNIVSVTRQVVEGVSYDIKMNVILSDCGIEETKLAENCNELKGDVPKLCKLTVWDRSWLKRTEYELNCNEDSIKVEFEKTGDSRSKRQVPGAPIEASKDDPEILVFVKDSLPHLDKELKSTNKHKLHNVVSVTKQVVAGINYNIKMYLTLSDCEINEVKDVENCNQLKGDEPKLCELKVWDRSWLKQTEYELNCNKDAIKVKFEKNVNSRSKRQSFGAPEEASKDDPEILLFIKDSLPHLDKEVQSTNKHKIQNIESVTKQVVAGISYEIKMKVVLSECGVQDSKEVESCSELKGDVPKSCKLTVWDRPWLKQTVYKMNCNQDKIKLQFEKKGTTRSKRQALGAPGAPVEASKDDPEILIFVKDSLPHLDKELKSTNKHKLHNVVSVTKQVVAGINYNIKMYLTLSDCEINEVKDVENCNQLKGDEPKLCELKVWDRSWLKQTEYELNCNKDTIKIKFEKKETTRSKRQVPGAPVEATKDDPQILLFAKDSLPHLDKKVQTKNKHKVQNIVSATKQVVAGMSYEIKMNVILSDCGVEDTKEAENCNELKGDVPKVCKLTVWDRPWLKQTKYKLKCNEDSIKVEFEKTGGRSKRQIPGGAIDATNDALVQRYVNDGLTHLNSQVGASKNNYQAKRVVSATKRVVAGVLYEIVVEMWDNQHPNGRECDFKIWDQAWTNFRQTNITCDDLAHSFQTTSLLAENRVTKRSVGAKYVIPGTINGQHDPTIFLHIGNAMRYLDQFSKSDKKYHLKKIVSAERQTVSGSLYRIQIQIGLSDCSKYTEMEFCNIPGKSSLKQCIVKVWQREWLSNNEEYKIKCDDDEDVEFSFKMSELESTKSEGKMRQSFNEYLTKFNKTYLMSNEYTYRYKVFKDNLNQIDLLNKHEQGTATYGITRFADLTKEEFSRSLGLRQDLRSENEVPFQAARIPDVHLPTEFDWRTKNAVTEVKDQGQCGSCWAFSTTGNVEGQYAIKYGKLMEFSEQELVDCDTMDQGCNGGLMDNAYQMIEKLGGLETESDYPYDAEDEKCTFKKDKSVVQLSGALNISQDETAMAKWLVKNGPIAIAINANAMQFYVGGVSHPWKFLCSPKSLDHGVLVVGYGVHKYSYFNKTLPYWIVKNSWGPSWGEQGYYRVYRGDGTCGVNQTPSSAIVA